MKEGVSSCVGRRGLRQRLRFQQVGLCAAGVTDQRHVEGFEGWNPVPIFNPPKPAILLFQIRDKPTTRKHALSCARGPGPTIRRSGFNSCTCKALQNCATRTRGAIQARKPEPSRSMDFCDVLLVGFPGLIDGRVLRALRSLPRRTLIPLVQEPGFGF